MYKKISFVLPFLFTIGCSIYGPQISSKSKESGEYKAVKVINEKRVTFSKDYDYSPVWASKGEDIIYKSIIGEEKEHIYAIRADGFDKRLITTATVLTRDILCGIDFNDRRQELLFVQQEQFVNRIISDIWIFNIKDKKKIRFTADFATASYPAWSADGKKILYVSDKGGSRDIWTIEGEGRLAENLTEDSRKNNQPVWSPDKQTIAFSSTDLKSGRTDIWIMDSKGHNKRPLTNSRKTGWNYFEPHFSPDGKYIVFYAANKKGQHIFVMSRDGYHITQLTNSPHADFHPKWSPKGNKITFAREADNSSSIYTIDVAVL